MSRPANNDHANWNSHETITTDGPGGFGAGLVRAISADGRTLTVGFKLNAAGDNAVGGSVMICGGGGLGQRAEVVSATTQPGGGTVLQLASALDGHVAPEKSTVCVVATVGSKLIHGNFFTWGMVVQWFGVNTRGVIADNNFTDCNVQGGAPGNGAIEAFGLCYGGAQPMFNAEYTGNHMVRSNGISLTDSIVNSESRNDQILPQLVIVMHVIVF